MSFRRAMEVTLKSLDNADEFPERKFVVLPGKPVMIGRASKTESKDITARPSNAWLSNQVVSRDHAELTLDARPGLIQRLFIEDLNSMHGTLVNDKKIRGQGKQMLKSGDILVFGDDIFRGEETFLPSKFTIMLRNTTDGFMRFPPDQTSSYRVPSTASDDGHDWPNSEAGELDMDDEAPLSHYDAWSSVSPSVDGSEGNEELYEVPHGSQDNPVEIADDTDIHRGSWNDPVEVDDDEEYVPESAANVVEAATEDQPILRPSHSFGVPSESEQSEDESSEADKFERRPKSVELEDAISETTNVLAAATSEPEVSPREPSPATSPLFEPSSPWSPSSHSAVGEVFSAPSWFHADTNSAWAPNLDAQSPSQPYRRFNVADYLAQNNAPLFTPGLNVIDRTKDGNAQLPARIDSVPFVGWSVNERDTVPNIAATFEPEKPSPFKNSSPLAPLDSTIHVNDPSADSAKPYEVSATKQFGEDVMDASEVAVEPSEQKRLRLRFKKLLGKRARHSVPDDAADGGAAEAAEQEGPAEMKEQRPVTGSKKRKAAVLAEATIKKKLTESAAQELQAPAAEATNEDVVPELTATQPPRKKARLQGAATNLGWAFAGAVATFGALAFMPESWVN